MKAEIEVLHPGLFSTIQDKGRFGSMKFGVPLSGSMDSYSAKMANLILQNSPGCAVLEITQMGPKLKFSEPVQIVITGADLSPMINNKEIRNYIVYTIKLNDILSFGRRKTGCRSYLGISGGFQSEVVLGSKSWYDGVTEFSNLAKGMKLGYLSSTSRCSPTNSALKPSIKYISQTEVPVFPGPEYEKLPEVLQCQLNKRVFSISKNNNRMAVQLEELFLNSLNPIVTGPVVPGTVQLTPGGKLIVLMRDCQTTGGYPRVLQLSEKALDILSQKIVGDKISLQVMNI
jgi:biotin-dependent carboxylase-like uncharacterized protein